MFTYDVVGLLFLAVAGAFLLSAPLIIGSVLVWLFDRIRASVEAHRRLY